MEKEDSLHQLIQSLSSQEKRLFKVYVAKNVQTKDISYVDLFDVLCKMDVYNEPILLKKLPKTYHFKNLVQHKKYLKDAILKCMRELDENSAQDTLNELMREQIFLEKKNLRKEQWKRLMKAQDLALKYEEFDQSLHILEAKMSYLIEKSFDESLAFFESYQKEKEQILWKQKVLSELHSDKNFVFQLLRKYKKNIDPQNLKLAESLVNKYKEHDVLALASFKISNLYYTLLSNYMDLQENLEETCKYRLAIVNLYKSYPWMLENNNKRYLIAYFNYLSALFRLEKFEEMKQVLLYLESVSLNNENEAGEFFQNHSLYSVLYWMNTGKIEEASLAQESIKMGVKKYAAKINASTLLTLYYNYALVFFCNEKQEDALHWLENIANIKQEVRMDLKAFAKVLSVVCHYELGNTQLIESLVRSIRRNTALQEIHKELLSVLLALANMNVKEKNILLLKLESKLKASPSFVGKDIISIWIRSYLNKESIHAIYTNSLSQSSFL